MKKLLTFLGVIAPTPTPTPTKKSKPPRVAVHLKDGRSIAHYANFRTVTRDGFLTLHNHKDGESMVAEYVPDVWSSVTTGKRMLNVKEEMK